LRGLGHPSLPALMRLRPASGYLRRRSSERLVIHSRPAFRASSSPHSGISSPSDAFGATRTMIPSCSYVLFRASSRNLRHCFPRWHLSWAFIAVRRIRSDGVHILRSSTSGFVPHPGILTLSTVSSSIGLAGLFHPANALRLSLQGFSLSRSRTSSSLATAVLPLLRR